MKTLRNLIRPLGRPMSFVLRQVWLLTLLCFGPMPAWGQGSAGTVDLGFNPGFGPNYVVSSITGLRDGRMLVGGGFSQYDRASRNGLARVHADGSLDTSFNVGSGVNAFVLASVEQADGRVIVGGTFTNYNGAQVGYLVRITTDGTRDSSYYTAPGLDGSASALGIQGDGKVLVGGSFDSVHGMARPALARLNPNGSLDTQFNTGWDTNTSVSVIRVLGDGRLLVAVHHFQGNVSSSHVVRLLPEGGVDPSFALAAGADGSINDISVQADGRVLVCGTFTNYDGLARKGLTRLLPDGGVDAAFTPALPPDFAGVCLATQPDGKILLGGTRDAVGGLAAALVRLEAGGATDAPYAPAITGQIFTGFNSVGLIWRMWLPSDGQLVIGGAFQSVNGTSRYCLARLHGNGSTNLPGALDASFSPPAATFQSVVTQRDGKFIVTGPFSFLNGSAYNGIGRLRPDGAVDTAFDPGDGLAGTTGQGPRAALQVDGKILVFGSFTTYNNTPRQRIARLLANGAVDGSFAPSTPLAWSGSLSIRCVATDVNTGMIYVGGDFLQGQAFGLNGIARMNGSGVFDNSFNPGSGLANPSRANTLAVQGDGKLLVGGSFTAANGYDRPHLVRLSADGGVDLSFRRVGLGASYLGSYPSVFKVLLQPDGRIVIAGDFVSVNGVSQAGIARLLPNGNLDLTFNPGGGLNGPATDAALQTDGKVLVSGSFRAASGAARTGLARFMPDGSLERHFNPLFTAGSSTVSIEGVSVAADGSVIAHGNFTSVNGISRSGMVRLRGDAPAFRLGIGRVANAVEVSLLYQTGQRFTLQSAPEVVGPWTTLLSTNAGLGGVYRFIDTDATIQSRRFFRALPSP